MNYPEYAEMMIDVPLEDDMEYAFMHRWPFPERFTVNITGMACGGYAVVRIPKRATNRHGRFGPVTGFSKNLFKGRAYITDIILPLSIWQIPAGAFAGCTGLKRITIPKGITEIRQGTFQGCHNLEDIYFEGGLREWEQIYIEHRRHETEFGGLVPGTSVHSITAERDVYFPGNEALFTANIHYRCDLSILYRKDNENE